MAELYYIVCKISCAQNIGFVVTRRKLLHHAAVPSGCTQTEDQPERTPNHSSKAILPPKRRFWKEPWSWTPPPQQQRHCSTIQFCKTSLDFNATHLSFLSHRSISSWLLSLRCSLFIHPVQRSDHISPSLPPVSFLIFSFLSADTNRFP